MTASGMDCCEDGDDVLVDHSAGLQIAKLPQFHGLPTFHVLVAARECSRSETGCA